LLLTTYGVKNTNDSGPGSLRQAIIDSNAATGATNTINFSIGSGGVQTIAPLSPLPALTKPVLINGTTQPGFDRTKPVPLIQIDGQSNKIIGDGLILGPGSGGSTIQGLDISGFNSGAGIHIESSKNLVQGNQIDKNSGDGVLIDGVDLNLNTIGGSTSGTSNTISGNSGNGVEIAGSNGHTNLVQGNQIGGNFGDGVLIGGDGPNLNTIGGSTSGASNTIDVNFGNGVEIAGFNGHTNLVQGNQIGGNFGGDGVLIAGSVPSFNTIGGSTSGASNTIDGNSGNGVEIVGSAGIGNLVQGNQLTGNSGDGVFIGSFDLLNTIGGTAAEARNTISGNRSNGVQITGRGNTVQGNFIGTDSSGDKPQPNVGNGVLIIAQAGDNTIGGTAVGARNIISGNAGNGVQIFGSRASKESGGENTVQDNYIGTDKTGTQPVPNDQGGVSIIGANPASGTYITICGNVISGNNQNGISIASSTGIRLEGNCIGTDKSGTSKLPNMQNGVAVSFVSVKEGQNNNTIGGTTSGARNVISGNGHSGIVILSSTGTLVEGNFIGTDKSGTSALPNVQHGIWVINSDAPNSNTPANTIGGTTLQARNVISGNGLYGILIQSSSGTLIEGNLIGTDETGQSALGNVIGVLFVNSQLNTVGGTVAGAENVISGNTSYGIEIIGPSSTNSTGNNQILGNLIGPDSLDHKALPSGSTGVLINDSVGNTIGGTTATSGNVIAGNIVGVEISGFNTSLSGFNSVLGNDIGIAKDGTPIGNVIGIWVNNVPKTQIGSPGIGNDIADNTEAGVYIIGANATGNLVQGNIIGLGPDGQTYNPATKTSATNPFPIGVYIQDSSSNTIGGAGAVAGNTISGNNVGVYIFSTNGSSFYNQVLGNFIGLSKNGSSRPGNVLYGVMLYNAPYNNAPQSGPSRNQFANNGIANFREFSDPVATTQTSSSGQASGSKAKKPAHHSNHVVHQSPRRTAPHTAVQVHGRQVPAGPIRKPRARVRE